MFELTTQVYAQIIKIVHAALAHKTGQHFLTNQLCTRPPGAFQTKKCHSEHVLARVMCHNRGIRLRAIFEGNFPVPAA
jgi:hypothetical protein